MPEPYRLRLFENYRFVLYAPFYAAHATGAYADEGLDVALLASPGRGGAEATLAAGEVDVLSTQLREFPSDAAPQQPNITNGCDGRFRVLAVLKRFPVRGRN